jgi:beta-galactosidase
VWTEWLHPVDASVVASYVDGPLPGVAAVTRREVGSGTAWYVGTRLDEASTDRLISRLITESGVQPAAVAPAGVEVVRRRSADHSYLFVINHTERDAQLDVAGTDLLTGARCNSDLHVASGEIAVIREDPA